VTNDECRAEALKRVEESDRLLEDYLARSGVNDTDEILYNRVAHLRQTAAVYAALAGRSDG
jgi:hypothetical protein